MRLWVAFLLAIVAASASAASGPIRLAGEAQIGKETPIRVHVELTESAAGVRGAFTTEDTQLSFEGKREADVISGRLGASQPVGTARLRLTSEGAEGSFDLAGQRGVLRLALTSKDAPSFLHPVQNTALTAAQWSEDLDELVSILTTKHGGPFDHISRRAFFAAVADTRRLITRRTGVQNALAFRKLSALIGDGHTEVAFLGDRPLYPFETFSFEDGVRVIAAPPEQRELLGARLIAVDAVPIAGVLDRLRPYIGQHETEWAFRSSFPWLLQRVDLLDDAQLAHRGSARFTFILAGKRRTITLVGGPQRKDLVRYGRGAPLWQRRPEESFWYERWPRGTVYVDWRSYEDLGEKTALLLADLDARHPARLIIDLRDSGGGDFNVGRRFIEELRKRSWLNKRGTLFELVGRRTFSAAMTNSVDFRRTTNAILVGEPAGAAPNGWQEVRSFYLSNSGLRASVSTSKYEFLPGKREVDPDVLIPARLSDWATDTDAATRYILRRH